MAEPLLRLEGVRAGYGEAVVLHDISFALPENGSLAVLGRNGVGKSTLLLTIMGYTQLRAGKIIWRGQDISRQPPHQRARLGIGWVAQEREIFPSLSVEENLTVACRPGPWDLAAVYALFPRLNERRGNMGNQLSACGWTNPGRVLPRGPSPRSPRRRSAWWLTTAPPSSWWSSTPLSLCR